MLGRRYYRIKVLQALYGFFQGSESRPEIAGKNLLRSIDKFYELYYMQLSFLLEVVDFYRRRMEDAKHKFYPTEDELNPNQKFLDNSVIRILVQNKNLRERIIHYKISWTEEQELVRKIYLKIKESKEHKAYLASGTQSYAEDREFVYRIYKRFIARSMDLQYYFEEKYIHWHDDYDISAAFVLKTLKLLTTGFPQDQAFISLFEKEADDDPAEDKKFILELFRKTIVASEEYEKMIGEKTRNWELDRIALTDIILIKMALTELIHFPTIPVKVTLNEYIEISKYFSTPKSKLFINGILDKLVAELQAGKKIKKKGRGLIT